MINPKFEEIKSKVGSDPRWVSRSIIAIYNLQTREEQNKQRTLEYNGIGFNGIDSEILSSFAKQLLNGRTLSVKQLAIAYRKMPKYSSQLCQIAGIPKTIKKGK